jgi:hypothetical protein
MRQLISRRNVDPTVCYPRARMGIRRPEASDFEVHRFETFIEVTFRPTRTVYTFTVHKGHGKSSHSLSPAHVRHARRNGDTGEYPSPDVHAMARRLAEREMERR